MFGFPVPQCQPQVPSSNATLQFPNTTAHFPETVAQVPRSPCSVHVSQVPSSAPQGSLPQSQGGSCKSQVTSFAYQVPGSKYRVSVPTVNPHKRAPRFEIHFPHSESQRSLPDCSPLSWSPRPPAQREAWRPSLGARSLHRGTSDPCSRLGILPGPSC